MSFCFPYQFCLYKGGRSFNAMYMRVQLQYLHTDLCVCSHHQVLLLNSTILHDQCCKHASHQELFQIEQAVYSCFSTGNYNIYQPTAANSKADES